MFSKTANTWDLVKASWNVLKSDKALIAFPLFSGLSLMLVFASFTGVLVVTDTYNSLLNHETVSQYGKKHSELTPMGYGVTFLFYLVNYFVISFFNSALVFCALQRLQGQTPTWKDGMREAFKRVHLIFAWAVVAATVGMVLRAIAERFGIIGKIVSGLIGIAFSLASVFVIPVMVAENKGPIQSLEISANLFTKTWGKQLKGSIGLGAVFTLLVLLFPCMLFVSVIAGHGNVMIMSLGIGLSVAYMIVLMLGQTALTAIFQSALYLYAKDGTAPVGFSNEMLHNAAPTKKEKE